MKNKEIIAVLDSLNKFSAFIDESLTVHYVENENYDLKSKLQSVLDIVKVSPKIRSEIETDEAHGVGLKSIDKNDDMYFFAISEELNRAGFTTKVIPEIIKNSLIALNSFPNDERLKLIGDLLNIPNDIEPEAMVELESILKDLNK